MLKKISLAITLLLVLVYVGFTCRFGVSPIGVLANNATLQQNRRELFAARQTWESHQINSYRIRAQIGDRIGRLMEGHGIYHGGCILVEELLTIRDGIVVSSDVYPLYDCYSVYAQLTVDRMLEYVSKELEESTAFGASLTIEFDPEYGYVTRFIRRSTCPLLGECDSHPTLFSFSDFEIIHPP